MVLFARNGVSETSMDAIADLAEVSDTTVYNYFPTKDDLVDAFLSAVTGANSLVAQLSARPSSEGALTAFRMLLEDSSVDHGEDLAQRQMLVMRVRSDKLLWGAYLRGNAELATALAGAFEQREPSWDPKQALIVAHAAIGVCQAVFDLQSTEAGLTSWMSDLLAALKQLEIAFPATSRD
jgi:AcrR family transcriptional regulator